MEEGCFVCGKPIDPDGFFSTFRGLECRLMCSRGCSDREEAVWKGLLRLVAWDHRKEAPHDF